MSTKTATGRSAQVEEILGAFGMRAGGTVSGVAYGGRFKEDAAGASLETHDPTTGEVLAHVRSHPKLLQINAGVLTVTG